MTTDQTPLPDLGWRNFFQTQMSLEEFETLTPMRVTAVHRTEMEALGPDGPARLSLPEALSQDGVTVGDWLLVDGTRPVRALDRQTLLQRLAAGTEPSAQLIAANIDTLFIVSSCNADFNIARLERYLALAHQADIAPVIVLTKADLCDDPEEFVAKARETMPGVEVISLQATAPDLVKAALSIWCGAGQTVALVGSSGVGKSTLVNALTGAGQDTSGIREDDARGRHTTTGRSLHRMDSGGWLVDTPGMRSLRLLDHREGVDAVFEDISALASQCRFADCAHEAEPGCAIRAAIAEGRIDADRLSRWQKLLREDARHSESLAAKRSRERKWKKQIEGGKARSEAKRRGWGD